MTSTKDDGDIIQKSMGVFGKWHFWICFAIFLVKFPVAWHQLNIVIVAPAVEFNCSDHVDKCAENCTSHIFDRSMFKETIVTQWDLVCDRAYLANMAQTITMLGILVGNVVFGFWSDRWGRRDPLVAAVILQVLTGAIAAFVPYFWLFLVFRFLVALATGGSMLISFVLIMEIVGDKWRTMISTLFQIPFNFAHMLLAALGYFLRDWHQFQLAISLPSIILISYWWVLPESPRWLITVGRLDDASEILETAARRNGLPTANIRENIEIYAAKKKNESVLGGKFMDLVRTSNMRVKTLCISFNWLVCGLCFYGIAQYIGRLGGNLFINIAVSAASTVPGTLASIFLMEKIGRRATLVLANVIAGCSMLLIIAIPAEGYEWAKPTLGATAMFGMSTSFCTVYMYSGELYPTMVRNIGIGTSSVCARLGSLTAPFVSTLGEHSAPWSSPLIFGIVPLIGALLCYFLPETLNRKLPDTVEEATSVTKKSDNIIMVQK